MRSPGREVVDIEPGAPGGGSSLDDARDRERSGCIAEAIAGYESAIAVADGEPAVLSEALRRLAVLRQQQGDSAVARALCERSLATAQCSGSTILAGEALNTLGGILLSTGALEEARCAFVGALDAGGHSGLLCARVEQNLGILSNIQGDLEDAQRHYRRSLEAYHDAGDQHGSAIAFHNLGMVAADGGLYDKADRYFRESREIAERVGDQYLRGLCLVNHAEVDVARQRYENARESAEAALVIFDQLGARGPKADAYRVIGMVYREIGRPAVAESRLRAAVELAGAAGSVLGEAEACRELALTCQGVGRNRDALEHLGTAHRLFQRLDARVDLVNVAGKMAALEGAYLGVVREWGRSLESSDRFTFGHCERVARLAVAIARALDVNEREETTILVGAYLHDVGMVRVPHEILAKCGPLTLEERAIVRRHPTWGVELLAGFEFPWDIKPIIRWHHEHWDGSGYPDGLSGDAVPLGALIVGIAEVWDAITHSQSGRSALPPTEALEDMERRRRWWSERVFAAFLKAQASVGA